MDEAVNKNMDKRRFLALGLIVVSLLLLAGILFLKKKAANSPAPQSMNAQKMNPDKAEILINGFAYTPSSVTVAPGAKITVINKDSAGHSVTSEDAKFFDSKVLGKNQSGVFSAPTAKGTYSYHCSKHPSMKGTLVVE